ncbi:DUF4236 domain-containing protein [Pantoea septica]
MGFRFRKRIKIAPGLHLNLSKSGVSASIGGKGATINVGRKGVRSTLGIPGTGLSHTSQLAKFSATDAVASSDRAPKAAKSALTQLFKLAILLALLAWVSGAFN